MDGRGKERGVVLSKRLRMLAHMVTEGNRIVDVGCDHGFLSIYLVHAGLCPGALAMDVREGPLAGAKAHVEAWGLADYIELRRSDGLAEYRPGEADAMVCAGMGGRLMEQILSSGMEKARELRELILQPQSDLPRFRAFLRKAGFDIVREDAVLEEGRFYFAMKAVYRGTFPEKAESAGERELYDLYGERLLKERHPVLRQYLSRRERILERLAVSLEAESGASQKARVCREEVLRELALARRAISCFERSASQD